MHAAHGALVTVEQVLAVAIQPLHLLVELVERNVDHFVVGEDQGRALLLIGMTHIDDHIVHRRGADQLHFLRGYLGGHNL